MFNPSLYLWSEIVNFESKWKDVEIEGFECEVHEIIKWDFSNPIVKDMYMIYCKIEIEPMSTLKLKVKWCEKTCANFYSANKHSSHFSKIETKELKIDLDEDFMNI